MSMFEKDLAIGKYGEKKALAILRTTYGNNYEFVDVSNSVFERNKGDIAIISKATGNVKYIDIKNDRQAYDTGNIALELWYQFDGQPLKTGWINSQYDFLGVYLKQCDTLVILDFNKVKQIYQEKGHLYRQANVFNGENDSRIALVPITDLMDAVVAAAGDFPEWLNQWNVINWEN